MARTKQQMRKPVEVPPAIKAYIDAVVAAPPERLAEVLQRFKSKWEFEKGDLNVWTDLLNYFGAYFEKHVQGSIKLQLDGSFKQEEQPVSKETILQVLRVTSIILESSFNKHLYGSVEHLTLLLAHEDSEIVEATLDTLLSLVKKPLSAGRNSRSYSNAALSARLLCLCQGWGGKEEGLGLLASVTADIQDDRAIQLGSSLTFDFYAESKGAAAETSVGQKSIRLPDVHTRGESESQLLEQLTNQHDVPPKLRFSLLSRIRAARCFASLKGRRTYVSIRLLAFTILLQASPDPEELATFFANEPEFTSDLVALVKAEGQVPDTIRMHAVQALLALAQDRPRQSSILSIITAGGHQGVLPSVMQRSVGLLAEGDPKASGPFVEALLALVTMLASTSSGCSSLREAGLVPTLLPLIKDVNPDHVVVVSLATRILDAYMDFSNSASSLFREMRGVEDAAERLIREIDLHVQKPRGSALEPSMPPYPLRQLIKSLMRMVALANYASQQGNARVQNLEESRLPYVLKTIYDNDVHFGAEIFTLGATILAELINHDPTCYPVLHTARVPHAFLDVLGRGILPVSDALMTVPGALVAICLNASGLELVKQRKALGYFADVMSLPRYSRALHGETPTVLGAGLDELMRHVPSLRQEGVAVVLKMLKKVGAMGGSKAALEELRVAMKEARKEAALAAKAEASSPTQESTEPTAAEMTESGDGPEPMDTGDNETPAQPALQEEIIVEDKEIIGELSDAEMEKFLPDCIINIMRMLETILSNQETCRNFIEKKGIEALLWLYTLPKMPVTFGAQSGAAHSMTVAFRTFSPQHSHSLSKAVVSALKEQLRCAAAVTTKELRGKKLSDLETPVRSELIRHWASAECLLSLTSSMVRNFPGVIGEMCSGSAEVLKDLDALYKEAVWQGAFSLEESRSWQGQGVQAAKETTPPPRYLETEYVDRHGNHLTTWHSVSDVRWLRSHLTSRRMRATRGGVLEENGRMEAVEAGDVAEQALADLDDVLATQDEAGTPMASDSGDAPTPDAAQAAKAADKTERAMYEVVGRLSSVGRSMIVSMGKAIVVSSRRRDDTVSLSPQARKYISWLAESVTSAFSLSEQAAQAPLVVKCAFISRIAEDLQGIVVDTRRRMCNTAILAGLEAHGALQEVLLTFEASAQLLWAQLGKENSAIEKGLSHGLFDLLMSLTRFMEQIVNAQLLLATPSSAQLLVQPVQDASKAPAKDPESFLLALQQDVLDVVLPIWGHPLFAKSPAPFVESIFAIMTQIYSGVGDKKGQKIGAGGSAAVPPPRPAAPPPDEDTIAMIVEMGFTRQRAEEALRNVRSNSVEIAMEWLFNHPEEPPAPAAAAGNEEDELARALALSMGSIDTAIGEAGAPEPKEEEPSFEVPAVKDTLSMAVHLLVQSGDIAFSMTDLLVCLCNRKGGQDRKEVVAYLVEQLKTARGEGSLSTVAHVLALVMHEESNTRVHAAQAGLVDIVLELLTQFAEGQVLLGKEGKEAAHPTWVDALLLVLDGFATNKMQLEEEPNAGPGTASAEPASTAVPISEQGEEKAVEKGPQHKEEKSKEKNMLSAMCSAGGLLSGKQQQQAMTISCKLLQKELPPDASQAVLQLASHLSKSHKLAVQFLDSGALSAILNRPEVYLLPRFDPLVASIIRHILEDPHTLQQAMEAEIKQALVTTLARQMGTLSPRMFLTTMAPVICREPTVFMQAAAAVCQVEKVNGRPTVVLKETKEKGDKGDQKDKPKDEKKESSAAKSEEPGSSEAVKSTPSKPPRVSHTSRKISHSFTTVINQLLEVVLHYSAPQSLESPTAAKADEAIPMDVDTEDKGKAKVEEEEANKKEVKGLSLSQKADVARVLFVLRLLTEFCLLYSSCLSVVLKRDWETGQGKGTGLLHHILHQLVTYRPPGSLSTGDTLSFDLLKAISSTASSFLNAICLRSSEGRKRLLTDMAKALLSVPERTAVPTTGEAVPEEAKVDTLVGLALNLLSVGTTAGLSGPSFSADTLKTTVEAGMIQSLTHVLSNIDLDHPRAPQLVNKTLKALEALTRVPSSSINAHRPAQPRSGTSARTEGRSEAPVAAAEAPQEERAVGTVTAVAAEEERQAHDEEQDRMDHDRLNQHLQRMAVNRMAERDRYRDLTEDLTRLVEDIQDEEDEEGSEDEMTAFVDPASYEDEDEGHSEDAPSLEGSEQDEDDEDEGEDDENDDEDDHDDHDDPEENEEDDPDGDEHLDPDHGPLTDEEGEEDEDEEEEDAEEDEVRYILAQPPAPPLLDDGEDEEMDMMDEDEEEEDAEDWQAFQVLWPNAARNMPHGRQVHPHMMHNQQELHLLGGGGSPLGEALFAGLRRSQVGRGNRENSYRLYTGGIDPRSFRADARADVRAGPQQHPLLSRGSAVGPAPAASWRNAAAQSILVGPAGATLNIGDPEYARLLATDAGMMANDSWPRGPGAAGGSFVDFGDGGAARRGVRMDRMSSWAEDSQLQGGSLSATIAELAEGDFVSQLTVPEPTPLEPERPAPPVPAPADSEAKQDEPQAMEESEQAAGGSAEQGNDPPVAETTSEMAVEQDPNRNAPDEVLAEAMGSRENEPSSLPDQRVDSESSPVEDTQMGEGGQGRDAPDASDGGSTMGESLRSLDVEIGSRDGNEDVHVAEQREHGLQVAHVDPSSGPGDASEQPEQHAHNDGAPPSQEAPPEAAAEGIDPTFLEALPPELRAEVLENQQAAARRQARQAALAALNPPAAAPAGGSDHPATDPPAGNPQPPGAQSEEPAPGPSSNNPLEALMNNELDPEFLAALPPDIQAEVLAQQRVAQAAARHAASASSADMDSASIIATFPPDLREEVLLTASEQVLAALPPALLAEAQLLRERHLAHYRNADPQRAAQRSRLLQINSVVQARVRGNGHVSSHYHHMPEARAKEAEGKPLLETEELNAILKLLWLAQPLGKGLLHRLLLNLCAHSKTRTAMLHQLLSILKPRNEKAPADLESLPDRLFGAQSNMVYARADATTDGCPPLVSRRVLDTLAYLARHSGTIAHQLLQLELPAADAPADRKGKAKVVEAEEAAKTVTDIPLALLLRLLSQPLYAKSNSHLEQLLSLIEVVMRHAESDVAEQRARVRAQRREQEKEKERKAKAEEEERAKKAAEEKAATEGTPAEGAQPERMEEGGIEEKKEEDKKEEDKKEEAKEEDRKEEDRKEEDRKEEPIEPCEAEKVLIALPPQELSYLGRLLAHQGFPDATYPKISTIVKLLANCVPSHRALFLGELKIDARNLVAPAVSELETLSHSAAVSASMDALGGAALLRVLLMIGYLMATKKGRDQKHEVAQSVIDELAAALEPVWQALSACVSQLETQLVQTTTLGGLHAAAGGAANSVQSLPPTVGKVLPHIEAFLMWHEKLQQVMEGRKEKDTPMREASSSGASSPKEQLEREQSLGLSTSLSPRLWSQVSTPKEKASSFHIFAERHRRLLNAFIRQNPTLLEGTFNLVLKTPRLIDFDNKRTFFLSKIRQQHEQMHHHHSLRVAVRRAYVLEDSYNQLRMRRPEELRGRLVVHFQGEEGIDAGGLTREWYQLLSRVIFDKGTLLFTSAAGNDSTYQPNPNSAYQTEHLSYFKFVGRVVGKALHDGQLLDVYFTRSFYKHILGNKITYHDIEAIDPEYYKNLKWMLDNDITGVLDLTFAVEADEEQQILYEKQQLHDHELKPGGRDIPVTEANKHEYVNLVAEHRMTTAIRPQINAFLEGFHELIPRELIAVFNDKELELLISGLPEIDIEDLKQNTEYTGFTGASPAVQWFWDVVRDFSKEDQARLLQFTTGTSKVPLEGFKALQGISGPQRFQIHKAYGAPERLPSAHTCFNQLDLPEYQTREQLQERLLLAIHEGSEGFGFG